MGWLLSFIRNWWPHVLSLRCLEVLGFLANLILLIINFMTWLLKFHPKCTHFHYDKESGAGQSLYEE
ncbi:hypothetical protein Bca4012_005830 [Brassica carinata]